MKTVKKESNARRMSKKQMKKTKGGRGMHSPLHKGTEVVLVHMNGDPDRPIIDGDVANAETHSPVTGGNRRR